MGIKPTRFKLLEAKFSQEWQLSSKSECQEAYQRKHLVKNEASHQPFSLLVSEDTLQYESQDNKPVLQIAQLV